VTLKDAQGNPAPGQAGTLTAETVKAANAELKGTWAEAGTAGTYSATYTAKTAGTGLKASLKLGSTTAASGTYAITAGTVTAATLTADKATYVAGGAITLTVELKDAQGNLVPNQAGTLTAETVKAANAELKGTWTETTPGHLQRDLHREDGRNRSEGQPDAG
jgi:adhesin/invasin